MNPTDCNGYNHKILNHNYSHSPVKDPLLNFSISHDLPEPMDPTLSSQRTKGSDEARSGQSCVRREEATCAQ